MKKIWSILALVLLGIIVFFGVSTWQEDQKYTIVPRVFIVNTKSVPPEHVSQIGSIVNRSVTAKLNAMSFDAAVPNFLVDGDTASLTVDVPKGITTERMLEAFNQELNFALMKHVPLDEAELIINDIEGYAPTGIVTANIVWVEFAEDAEGKGAMRIQLNEEGQQILQTVYDELDGEQVGVFIRNQLVAKLLVQSDNFDKDIRIFNIPDLNLATLVADDLVIGRYVTFSQ